MISGEREFIRNDSRTFDEGQLGAFVNEVVVVASIWTPKCQGHIGLLPAIFTKNSPRTHTNYVLVGTFRSTKNRKPGYSSSE